MLNQPPPKINAPLISSGTFSLQNTETAARKRPAKHASRPQTLGAFINTDEPRVSSLPGTVNNQTAKGSSERPSCREEAFQLDGICMRGKSQLILYCSIIQTELLLPIPHACKAAKAADDSAIKAMWSDSTPTYEQGKACFNLDQRKRCLCLEAQAWRQARKYMNSFPSVRGNWVIGTCLYQSNWDLQRTKNSLSSITHLLLGTIIDRPK